MGDKNIGLKYPLQGTKQTIFEEVPEIPYLEKKVRFSLRDCDTNTYCIRKLDNREITSMYKRLGYFEQITWKDVRQMRRENGFSIEKHGDSNFAFLSAKFPNFSTFLHFRVGATDSPFRVFGGMNEDLCYLLLIDSKGTINH